MLLHSKAGTVTTLAGQELWDFGDGSEAVEFHSDGNRRALSPDDYAVTTYRDQRSGVYVVRVMQTDAFGANATGLLHVHVD